jgi:hypothetical protein
MKIITFSTHFTHLIPGKIVKPISSKNSIEFVKTKSSLLFLPLPVLYFGLQYYLFQAVMRCVSLVNYCVFLLSVFATRKQALVCFNSRGPSAC